MLSRFAIAAIISSRRVAAAQLVDDNCPLSAAACALGEPEPLVWIASVFQHHTDRRAPLQHSIARLAGGGARTWSAGFAQTLLRSGEWTPRSLAFRFKL